MPDRQRRRFSGSMRCLRLAGLLACAGLAQAQIGVNDPDWQESDAPPPPAFSTDHLIAVDMPRYVSLKFGIDPATLSITPDGLVRYVMVAINASGTVNAMFEAIRCATGEVKTYARSGASGSWSIVKDPPWQALNGNQPSKHALALTRQGLCEGHTVAGRTPDDLIRVLKR